MKCFRLEITLLSLILFIAFSVFFSISSEISQEVKKMVDDAEKLILEEGRYGEAIKILEQAAGKAPDYAPVYLNTGRAYHFQEKYETAIGYYKKAIALDSNYGEAYYNIGSCYASMKNFDNAVKWLVQAKDVFYRKNELERYKKTLSKLVDYTSGSERTAFQEELSNYPPPTVTPQPTAVAVKATSTPSAPEATFTPVAILTPTPPAVKGEMVFISEGSFYMGSSEKEIEEAIKISLDYGDNADRSWFADELPRHEVYLDSYYIDKYEVTNEEFSRFVIATGYETDAERESFGYTVAWEGETILKEVAGADWQHPTGQGSSISGKMDYPVVQVSWNDATAYAAWSGKRLPTEAEWECACRGTEENIYPWGNKWNDNYCNNWNLNIFYLMEFMPDYFNGRGPLPGGKIPPGASPYGIMDMSGNMWEWCYDWYSEDYYAASSSSNPQGPQTGEGKVLRGGPWYYINPAFFRSTVRFALNKEFRSFFTGFRCVKDGK